MEQYKQEFIEFMVESDVLKFGDFTLKSGRKSPFFMNAGAYVTGSQLSRLGEYVFNITYPGDSNFNRNVSDNYVLNITQDSVNITSSNVTVVYGSNGTVSVTLNNTRATGVVTVNINGVEFNGTLVNGAVIVNVTCDMWAVGEYVFNITYPGDHNFTDALSANYILNITQDSVNITSSNVTVVYGSNATISVTLNNTRATGNVTVNINGTEFNGTLVDGAVIVNIT